MGSKILYFLVILPISKLPFGILYLLSDFLYLILYRIVGYRTKVVRQNLKNSFPEKSKKEIKSIESKFYKHLCDTIFEGFKAFSISNEEGLKRMLFSNPEVINRLHKKGKSVIMVGGHYGNWELIPSSARKHIGHRIFALYTPLSNSFMDERLKESRSRFGMKLISTKKIINLVKNQSKELFTIIFLSDQAPRKSQRSYWINFLNQETGVQFGAERFAKSLDAAVVFYNVFKLRRGFYDCRFELITADAKSCPTGFITESHSRMLEKIIQKEPAYWLWSHKRWKHKRPDGEVIHETNDLSDKN